MLACKSLMGRIELAQSLVASLPSTPRSLPKEAGPGLRGLPASVTPREVSFRGLSTCRVISFRKAENFAFSCTVSFLAAMVLRSMLMWRSPPSWMASSPSPWPRRETASRDLDFRKLTSPPQVVALSFFAVFFSFLFFPMPRGRL